MSMEHRGNKLSIIGARCGKEWSARMEHIGNKLNNRGAQWKGMGYKKNE